MPRLRTALLAVAALALAVPAVASAAPNPTDCLEPDPESALCVLEVGGGAAQQAEEPLIGPRDTARTSADRVLEAAGLCDGTDHAACLLPFPNDAFTVADPSTPTGRRVAISPLSMPRNIANKPLDPTEFNRNDGWSAGTAVLTSVPGLSLTQSGIAGIRNPAASLAEDAPVLLLDAQTGERHPYWAELDGNPTAGEQPLLIIRPTVNFAEGHRYVVGIRDQLKTASGAAIAPNDVYAARRAEKQAEYDERAGRPKKKDKAHGKSGQEHGKGKPVKGWSDPVYGPLAAADVEPDETYLAWTFTVASTKNTTQRMLHIRDDAFADLGNDGAPAFSISSTKDNPDGNVRRRITGSFTMPSYLTSPANPHDPVANLDPALPGTRFFYDPTDGDDLPDRTGLPFTATFTCNIPKAATADAPSRGSIYGHGLLGGQEEVNAGNVREMGQRSDITFCATHWYGMATGDIPNVATMLADMSNFPTLPDRVQQGMLAQLFLARLLKSPAGFASSPAFQDAGKPLVAPGSVFYDGNSQGGIIGGALLGVAQDITRGALGVPAMNYSTLLDRSTDFARYESVFNAAYPSETEREVVFGLIQMLWDRAEANGYAAHITNDPLPGTPSHAVLMHVAFGDHQVANVAAEVMARTIGAQTNPGFLEPGRHWGVDPGWDIPRIDPATAYTGSAFVYWDSGTATPPDGNVPAVNGAGVAGHDPHSDPRATARAQEQKDAFLRTGGTFVDTCAGAPCYAGSLAR
ncbi:MAG: hypothetical protein LC789_05110 [Actinobacteria bacterium]|nr:hypothetical protein [Actinomycetota bacterium]